jgi:hypothetical protein
MPTNQLDEFRTSFLHRELLAFQVPFEYVAGRFLPMRCHSQPDLHRIPMSFDSG